MSNTSTLKQLRSIRESRQALKERLGRLSFMNRVLGAALVGCVVLLFGTTSARAQLAFQGFETDTGDWTPITTRVPSGGGVLGLPSASGNYHA